MKKTLIILALFVFIISHKSIQAQKISHNDQVKVKKTWFLDYIDGNNDYYFLFAGTYISSSGLYASGRKSVTRIVKLDHHYDIVADMAIEYSYKMDMVIETFLKNNEINVFYHTRKGELVLEKFDEFGQSNGAKIVDDLENFDYIIFSPNHDFYALKRKSKIDIFDHNHNLYQTIKESNVSVFQFELMDNGDVYYLRIAGKKLALIGYQSKSRNSEPIKIDEEFMEYEFILKAFPEEKKLYLGSLIGFEGENKRFASGLAKGDDIKTMGAILRTFDLESIKIEKKAKELFSQETYTTCFTDKKREHEALIFMSLDDIILMDDQPILQIYKNWVVTVTNGSSTTVSYPYHACVLINTSNSAQTAFVMDHKLTSSHRYMSSSFLAAHNNKIYVYYYKTLGGVVMGKGYTLKEHVFDNKLYEISQKEIFPYRAIKNYHKLNEVRKIDEGKYLLINRWSKQIGTSILDLN